MFVPQSETWGRLDSDSRAQLRTCGVRDLARRSTTGSMVYFATAAALLFASSCLRDHPAATCAALFGTFLGGGLRWFAASRLLRPDPSAASPWTPVMRWAAHATAACWGAYCAFVYYHYTELWPSDYLIVVGAALAGGATNSLAPDRKLGSWVLAWMIAPVAVTSIAFGTAPSVVLGLSAAGYLAYLMAQLRHNGAAYWNVAMAAALEAMLSRQAASRSEVRFRTLFDNAPNGIYLALPDGHLTMANPALAHMLGFAGPEDLVGRNLADFRYGQADLFRNIPDGEGPSQGLESDWIRIDGRRIRVRESVRRAEAQAAPEAGPGRAGTSGPRPAARDGDPKTYFQGTVEDVTGLFEADRARRLLAEILEETTDFVETISASGETLYLNRAGRMLRGAQKDRELSLWARGADPDLLAARLRAAHEKGIWQGESWLTGSDGRPVEVSQVVIAHKTAGETSYSIVSRDLSAVREAQNTLRETEEQLVRAQRLESLGRLAGGVAHDFNNLLTVVIGYGSLLREQASDTETAEAIDHMCVAARRAADLTKQLLAFGRKQVLERRIVDLNQCVLRAARTFRSAPRANIELVLDTAPEPILVDADADQIDQMLAGLLLNARDAMPDGGTVTVAAALVSDGDGPDTAAPDTGTYARLAVTDTGVGMDEDTVSRIFEPFFTTKAMGRGAGLGLASIYGFVNQSGGRIAVLSKPGMGSTFEIHLPARTGEPAPAVTSDPDPRAGGNERLLVVDDEPALRNLLRQTLQGGGYRVADAGSGNEALAVAKAAEEPFDLLVTDVAMPGLTGPQLAAKLRESFPRIGVLFVSGYPGEPSMGIRGAAQLAKPFTADTLLQSVRRQLDGGGREEIRRVS